MSDRKQLLCQLLLSYIGLLAERHAYGPGDGFEFILWDDLLRKVPELVSQEEKKELVSLIIKSDSWVAFDITTGMLEIINIDTWRLILENRDH
jgi:hypothetical protein